MIEDKSMKLYIDTSSNQQTIVQLGDKKLVRDSSVWKSQAVLPMLKELLGDHDLKEITEIKINPGPGSYGPFQTPPLGESPQGGPVTFTPRSGVFTFIFV